MLLKLSALLFCMAVSLLSGETILPKTYENVPALSSPAFAYRALPFAGPQSKPELLWRFQHTSHAINSSLTIDKEGIIYFGSDDNCVYALRPDGELQWKYCTQNDVRSSVVITKEEKLIFGSKDGTLYALDKQGALLWRYEAKSPIVSTPTLDSTGDIIFGDTDGYVHILDTKGKQRHRFKLSSSIRNTIAVDQNNTLYVGLENGLFLSFDKEGTINWTFQTKLAIESTAVIGEDGTIYIASRDWHLYALDSNGELKWHYRTAWYLSSSPVIGEDKTLYIGSWDWSVHAVSSLDGAGVWTKQPERSPNMSYFASQIVLDSNHNIYAASRNDSVYCLDKTGNLLWKIDIQNEDVLSGLLLHPNGTLLIPTNKGNLYAYKVLTQR